MSTKRISISMPEDLHVRMARFDRNWSAIARKSLEQEVRICEAMADADRATALREKAQADCSDVWSAGLEDATNYPIEEIDYRFLREFEERSRTYLEDSDPENLIAVFDRFNRSFHDDGSPAFRLRFQENWDYKLGFIEGLGRLKRIADGVNVPKRTAASLFDSNVDTQPES